MDPIKDYPTTIQRQGVLLTRKYLEDFIGPSLLGIDPDKYEIKDKDFEYLPDYDGWLIKLHRRCDK